MVGETCLLNLGPIGVGNETCLLNLGSIGVRPKEDSLGTILGPLKAILEPLEAILGPLEAILGPLEAILGPFGVILWPFWASWPLLATFGMAKTGTPSRRETNFHKCAFCHLDRLEHRFGYVLDKILGRPRGPRAAQICP